MKNMIIDSLTKALTLASHKVFMKIIGLEN